MNDNTQGYFINGRAQVIEMLKYMTEEEKNTLLKNIKTRNPQLAGELLEKSISFGYIKNLNDDQLALAAKYTDATIMGIALKGIERAEQQRVLSSLPREYAEKAFSILVAPIKGENEKIMRAQGKVLQTILLLKRRALI